MLKYICNFLFIFKNVIIIVIKKVGDESIKGITGGERKRTSIAVELITDPNLILLDGLFILKKTIDFLIKNKNLLPASIVSQPS